MFTSQLTPKKNAAPDQAPDQAPDHSQDGHDHDHAHDHDHPTLPIAPNSNVTVTLPWTTVEPTYQKGVRRFAKNAKVDGFRKGKVPAGLAEQMINQSALVEHVLQQVLPEAYAEAIKAADKKPISQPEIDPVKAEKGSDWELIAYFAETPEIRLGKYKDAIKKAAKESEKEIKDREEEVKNKAKKEKKPEQEAAAEEAQATPTTFTDAQKDDIRTKHIFKQLVEAVSPKIPELLVRREADRELRRLLDQLNQLKLSIESFLQSRQMTADQLRLEYISSAATTLQLEFILAEIGKEEKITAEENEVDETLKKMFGEKLTEEQRSNGEYRSYIFSTIVKQKIIKFLLSLT